MRAPGGLGGGDGGGSGSKELHELMDGRLKEGRPCLVLLPALMGHGPDGSRQV
jgi:hypothetical protein